MKKIIFAFSIIATSFVASAQAGKNQLGVGAEVGLITESGGGTFIGGTAKYMHGVGTAGQVTLTSGYLAHSETQSGVKATASEIPILLGYRHYFNGIFVEPQAGYILDHAKVTFSGSSSNFNSSASEGSFGYGIGGGYALSNGLDLGVSYRNTTTSGSVGMVVFRVGYNFSLGETKK